MHFRKIQIDGPYIAIFTFIEFIFFILVMVAAYSGDIPFWVEFLWLLIGILLLTSFTISTAFTPNDALVKIVSLSILVIILRFHIGLLIDFLDGQIRREIMSLVRSKWPSPNMPVKVHR